MAMYWKNKHNLKNASLQNIRHTKIILKNIPKPNSYSGLGTHLYFYSLLYITGVRSYQLHFPDFLASLLVCRSLVQLGYKHATILCASAASAEQTSRERSNIIFLK